MGDSTLRRNPRALLESGPNPLGACPSIEKLRIARPIPGYPHLYCILDAKCGGRPECQGEAAKWSCTILGTAAFAPSLREAAWRPMDHSQNHPILFPESSILLRLRFLHVSLAAIRGSACGHMVSSGFRMLVNWAIDLVLRQRLLAGALVGDRRSFAVEGACSVERQ